MINYSDAETEILSELRTKLSADYYFHNWEHTSEVIADAASIAEQCGCSNVEIVLLKTAALCHDTGYLVQYARNEAYGVAYARQKLPAYGYDEQDLKIIADLILATAFPYHPQNKLENIICDADLYYILTERFMFRAKLLRQEFAIHWRTYTDKEWENLEKDFLHNITFFTDYARAAYHRLKPQLLASVENTFGSTKHE